MAAPPGYPYYSVVVPPKKSNIAMIIAIVLIVFVVVSIASSAILYIMVSGLLQGPAPGSGKPIMTLMLNWRTNHSATVLVSGIQPATSPSNFKVNIQVGTGFGTAVSLPSASGALAFVYVPSTGSFEVSWGDVGGDGLVSGGDYFLVTYPGPIASGTEIGLIVLWTDGSMIATATWQA